METNHEHLIEGSNIESDYGKGKVLVVTSQWIIHDNSLENLDKVSEFALLKAEDAYVVIE